MLRAQRGPELTGRPNALACVPGRPECSPCWQETRGLPSSLELSLLYKTGLWPAPPAAGPRRPRMDTDPERTWGTEGAHSWSLPSPILSSVCQAGAQGDTRLALQKLRGAYERGRKQPVEWGALLEGLRAGPVCPRAHGRGEPGPGGQARAAGRKAWWAPASEDLHHRVKVPRVWRDSSGQELTISVLARVGSPHGLLAP